MPISQPGHASRFHAGRNPGLGCPQGDWPTVSPVWLLPLRRGTVLTPPVHDAGARAGTRRAVAGPQAGGTAPREMDERIDATRAERRAGAGPHRGPARPLAHHRAARDRATRSCSALRRGRARSVPPRSAPASAGAGRAASSGQSFSLKRPPAAVVADESDIRRDDPHGGGRAGGSPPAFDDLGLGTRESPHPLPSALGLT